MTIVCHLRSFSFFLVKFVSAFAVGYTNRAYGK